MFLIELCVRRPVTIAVGVILIALFGTIAIYRMPLQLTPEVETPVLEIEARWLGTSPQEIEREIVLKIEEQLKGIEGVTKMTSESMDSMGRITLEFSVDSDMSKALLLVNTRLQQVRDYPPTADRPIINTSSSSNRFIAWFILNVRAPKAEDFDAFEAEHPELVEMLAPVRRAHSNALMLYRLREAAQQHPELAPLLPEAQDVTKLQRFAEDTIEARFERVDGVSNSNVVGGREDEMQVIVDPQKLAARHLTIGDVRDALIANNADVSAGDFYEGKRRMVVRTLGQLRSPEQVASRIVARRDGSPVYISDVAECRLGHKKADGTVRRFGTAVMAINVQRETGANVLDVMHGLREAMQELNDGVLKYRGLELSQVYDETEYIYSSIGLVTDNIVEAGILTFIVLLIFLRSVRSSIVIFISIAVSMVGMFLVLGLLGRSLNVLSMAGIAFAVGMLVDNFIVVLENIYRHYQNGDDTLSATVRGTRDVWGAVITATLANLAVFIPVLFVRDEAGQLFRDIAMAVSAALVISLFAALLLVPSAASRVLQHMPHSPADDPDLQPEGYLPTTSNNGNAHSTRAALASGGSNGAAGSHGSPGGHGSGDSLWRSARRLFKRLFLVPLDAMGALFVRTVVGLNAWLLTSVLLRLMVVAIMVGGAALVSWILMPKADYLPAGNRNLVFGILIPPPGYNLDHIQSMGTTIENALKPYWDVDPGSAEEAALDYPMIGDFFYVARGRQLFLGLRCYDPLKAGKLEQLVRDLGEQHLHGTIVIAKQSSLFESGLGAGRTVDIEITGPEIDRLIALGGQIFMQVLGNEQLGIEAIVPKAQAQPVPSLDISSPEIHLVPLWDQAADMNVSARELGYWVDALVDGAYATDYFLDGQQIDLRILGEEQYATRSEDLAALPVAIPTGNLVSLNALAEQIPSSGPEQINRRERQRAITIKVTPPPEMAVEEAMLRIREGIVEPLLATGQIGDGLYQINLDGTAEKLRLTWISLRWNLLLAVVITYLIMSALFESWLYPFVIILSVPLGAVGGFAGLRLMNLFLETPQPLDVLTMLGFIILVGTVVNNPILIVEQALVHIREDGMRYQQAILESVATRIRPIFMTASIGLFGLLPLVISPGAGSELYRGLGSVLLGGLVVSTLFTLILVPTLFSLTLEARSKLAQMLGYSQPTDPAAPQDPAAPHSLTAPRDTSATASPLPQVVVAQLVTTQPTGESSPSQQQPIEPHQPPASDSEAKRQTLDPAR